MMPAGNSGTGAIRQLPDGEVNNGVSSNFFLPFFHYSIIGYAELASLSSPAAAGSVHKLGSISSLKV
ncbi:MAG: hypothetical protein EHM93_10930 [Bacteroidales bacterium]|nr:MAG: hypothetical protein EHM93_10930 [Bacteroidales bacterium]